MKLRLLFTFLVMAMFTGCLSEEEILDSIVGDAPNVPEGTYFAECVVSGSDSLRMVLTLTATTRSVKEVTHTGVTDCSNAGTDGTPDEADISFSDKSLGDDISYVEEAGDFIPFQYKDGVLIFGEAVTDVNDAKVLDFIADPEGEADIIFTLQE